MARCQVLGLVLVLGSVLACASQKDTPVNNPETVERSEELLGTQEQFNQQLNETQAERVQEQHYNDTAPKDPGREGE